MSDQDYNPIVGVWEVNAPDAPFPWHMMTFTPNGTMSQSNPHEGNTQESDSSGQGIWQEVSKSDGNTEIIGKFVEMKADRNTGAFIGKGVIEFRLRALGDTFSGTSIAFRYNTSGERINGPLHSVLSGVRVTIDNLSV